MSLKNITNFIFELNQLKRLRHNGFQHAGVQYPDSVAEHVYRAAQIGYILAIMEGDANPEKVTTILLIHDNAETRVGDQNKVAARYYSKKRSRKQGLSRTTNAFAERNRKKWQKYFQEFESRNTKEGIIAKDADWLEQAFQAKEYLELGYQAAQNWIDNVEKALETKSAQKILKEMKKTSFTSWWQNLKKMTYTKINKK